MPQDAAHPDEDESTRLRRVYDAYAADEATQERWDPEQPGNRLILAERDGLLRDAIQEAIGEPADGPMTMVDLGCGDGRVLASVTRPASARAPGSAVGLGIDLLESRLQRARVMHPDLPVMVANGSALPLPTDTVDVVLVFTVFSSILDASVAGRVAGEIRRVVRPGGRVVWYDLRRDNPRNREVRVVTAHDIARLFPGWDCSLRTCTLLPPVARRAARVAPGSYELLSRIPALRTHHFGVLRAPAPADQDR